MPAPMARITLEVTQFLSRTFGNRPGIGDVQDHTPLFTGGLVDSFGVLQLIAFLVERFGVEIDTARHDLTDFDTLAKIETLVAALQQERSGR